MMSQLWYKLTYAWRIAIQVGTMPWSCLQSAVEQILQEEDFLEQEKQLKEWQRLKNSELLNVSFAVSPSSLVTIVFLH